MKQQENSQNSNWYNNRFVMILVFIAVYIIVPVLITVWGTVIVTDNTFTFTRISPDEISLIGVFYVIFTLLLFLFVLFVWFRRQLNREKLINKSIQEALKNGIDPYLQEALKNAISNTFMRNYLIKNVYALALDSEKAKDVIAEALCGNAIREAINEAFHEIKDKPGDTAGDTAEDSAGDTAEDTAEDSAGEKKNGFDELEDAISSLLTNNTRVTEALSKAVKANSSNDNEIRSSIIAALKDNKEIEVVIKSILDNSSINDAIASALKNQFEINNIIENKLIENLEIKEKQNQEQKQKQDTGYSCEGCKKLNNLRDILKSIKNFGKEEVARLEEAIKAALEVDRVKTGIIATLKNQVLTTIGEDIQQKIYTSVDDAIKKENNIQKYHFVEHVVDKICENNKAGTLSICAIRELIGSVLDDDYKDCCFEMIKDGNNVKLVITDNNYKQKILIFDNSKNRFTSDDTVMLCSGFKIDIKDGKIQSIT